jgi:pyruvate dehydrogenase E1 component alpha subunit
VFTTHRNHGHVLARGGEPRRILSEILGRIDGYSHGRAGGFHVAAPQLGILHTSAIVGGCIPLAAGAAFAAKRMNTGNVALAFFGDGAMEEGVASEALNMAQLWRVPVIFIMENNSVSADERTGRGSPTSVSSAASLADIPRAYGLTTECVDGSDIDAVRDACTRAVSAARRGDGPYFIEARTTRWPGNYGSAPTLSLGGPTDLAWAWSPESLPEPVRRWPDPLLRYARRFDRETVLAIDAEVREEMRSALEAALNSPEPPPETATELALA